MAKLTGAKKKAFLERMAKGRRKAGRGTPKKKAARNTAKKKTAKKPAKKRASANPRGKKTGKTAVKLFRAKPTTTFTKASS